jgi:hypothetical protein
VRLTRSTTALAAVLFALVAALVFAGPAQAAGPNYVALGDSYSSGNGAGNYITDSGDCHRSNSAYAPLWASAHNPASFTFAACSGAQTTDVINNQLGALNSSTGLVTITVGGTDAGYTDVITTCLTSTDDTCVAKVNTAESYINTTLPARLDAVYDAIRAKAPSARVVVLGYPEFYQLNTFCIGLSDTKHRKLNEAADVLDSVVSARAAAHGFVFGDVRPIFSTHELCSGSAWLHSVVIDPTWESYHPTATGHASGYLPVVNAND